MKKVIIIVLIGAGAFAGWRWRHDAVERSAQDRPAPSLAYNRMWVDHMPTDERDTFKALMLTWPEGLGAVGNQSRWHVDVERFYFEADGENVRAIFPWSSDGEQFTVHAERCNATGMDYCLDVTASNHLVKRYYSRAHWSRKTVDELPAFSAQLLAEAAK